jgi:hypothetical protein
MVFPRKKMRDVTDEILTDNDIRSQGSQQVLDVWGAKKGR